MNSNARIGRMLLDWVIIVLFLIFICLPEINRHLLIISDNSSSEQRTLASYPVFNIREISAFNKEFESFYNDHFGFRLQLVTANTRLHMYLFGISNVDIIPPVVIGKDGWLFVNLHGPANPMTFTGWQGYNPYSLDQLATIQENLEAENIWFAKRNITFLILPAPDKNSIYPEYLPRRFQTIVGPSRQAQIFDHMKLHSALELVDVRQTLLSAKKSYQLNTYYKTDSHWNNVGAFLAYAEIMKRLLRVYSELVPHRFEDFISNRRIKYKGDLAKIAKLDVSHILEDQLVPKENTTYNNMGLKKGTLLIFGDSFSDTFFKDYFHRHFNTVISAYGMRAANTQVEKHLVSQYQPDVVIHESVERHWAA